MKRKLVNKYPYLWKIYPLLFWKKCCMCKAEFVREKGWRAITGPYYNGSGRIRYLCESCAPTREVADDIFLNDKWLPPRPPPPMRMNPK